MYHCSEYRKTFSQKSSLNRHRKKSCLYQSSSSKYNRKRKPDDNGNALSIKKLRLGGVFTGTQTKLPELVLSKCTDCDTWYVKIRLYAHLQINTKLNSFRINNNSVTISTSAFYQRIEYYM